jgi:hypothetical protein
MTDLKSFIKNNSKYVDFKTVPSHTLKYINAKVVPNKFDADSETVEYTVEEDGVERTFTSQNIGLAQLLVDHEGEMVTITRTGEGAKTRWGVELAEDVVAET